MKSLTLAFVVILGLVAQVYSGCINCGFGPGRDVCTSSKGGQTGSCTPLIVRPNKLPKVDLVELCKPKVIYKEIKVPGFKPLNPIGDLCSGRKAVVIPARVPKTTCALCSSECGCSSSSSSSQASSSSCSDGSQAPSFQHFVAETSCGSLGGESSSYSTEYAQYAPADAVSLSLAYKLQHELNNIAEDKLFFGFHKMPKELEVTKKVKKVIAEENLHGLNGQIVELKPVIVGNSKTLDEEAEEALFDEELNHDVEEVASSNGVKKLTYGEIGFGPAKVKTTPFIEIQSTGESTSQSGSSSSSSSSVQECHDGFIPGKVILNPVRINGEINQQKSGYYGDDEEDEDGYHNQGGVAYPSFSYSSSHSTSSSSSASSSSSSSHHHSIGGHRGIHFQTLDSCEE